MNLMFLISVSALVLFVSIALILSRRSVIARVATVFLSLGGVAFSLFGFLASLEPSAMPNWPWQVGYGALGAGLLLVIVFCLKPKSRPLPGRP